MTLALALSLVAGVPSPTVLTTALGIPTRPGRRSAVNLDPVELQLVEGTFKFPRFDDRIGEAVWSPLQSDKDGWFSGGATEGGYLACAYDSPVEQTLILVAQGSSVSYVNGVIRAGDPYMYGYVQTPVRLKKGTNEFLFLCGRGRFRAELRPVGEEVFIQPDDMTTPDLVPSEMPAEYLGAAVVVNASQQDRLVRIWSEVKGGTSRREGPFTLIPALSSRKVAFVLAPDKSTDGQVVLGLDGSQKPLELKLGLKKGDEPRKVTFVSRIDNSVQYYGLRPASKPSPSNGLVLSLHGASVEAIGQAQAYGPHDDYSLACPTNRRPYGFDWEDDGRLDALEVLAQAKQAVPYDPRRVYLTGHSMGGHGTWINGALFPDLFAAVCPSAGWISFDTYANGPARPSSNSVQEMLKRASSAGNPLPIKSNYSLEGVYVLHGDKDDNVPVTEARNMVQELKGHPDLQYHEQPGAGHWWDVNPAPGADCVDWPGFFDLFGRRRLADPGQTSTFTFATPAPSVSSSYLYATLLEQEKPFTTSRITIDGGKVVTENLSAFMLDLPRSPLAKSAKVGIDVDGTSIEISTSKPVVFRKFGMRWSTERPLDEDAKNPSRGGGFKEVYRNRFELVYGTGGSPAERAWARQKAVFDAETWRYRGNGAVDVVPDSSFDPSVDPSRNVILYGNAQTNKAWSALLGPCPVDVSQGKLAFKGGRTYGRKDLACFFCYPRRGSHSAEVGVIGGTGIEGMKLADRVPIFLSGAGMPDFLVVGSDTLSAGLEGWAVAGYFANDWSFNPADVAYSPKAR